MRDLDIIPLICETIGRRKKIQVEDVAALAKFCHREIKPTPREVEAVFALALKNFPACVEWDDYFSATIGDWYVEDFSSNVISDQKAKQLIRWLGGEQADLSSAQFRLLTHVLERAAHCPESLLSFARACLKRTIGADAGVSAVAVA
jgi:hypothetical protein